MRVISLGSGSSGNALFVEAGPNGRTKILVDAGFSERILHERLRSLGVSLSQIQAILITHEHADHIIGLSTIVKRNATPLVGDPRTLAAIEQVFAAGILRSESGDLLPFESAETDFKREFSVVHKWSNDHVMRDNAIEMSTGSHRMIGDIEVVSFPVSHDAVAPCGYLLSAGGCRVCLVIDSGEVTPTMLEAMNQADLLILESNHDRQRLLRGPYPYSLKQRILSPTGHLSNDQAAEAVLRTWRPDAVRWLWLSHLSRTNNTPKIALHSMQNSLKLAGANLAHIHISVLPHTMGGVWDSTQLWHIPSLWEMQT